ncbi:YhgE/Pip domain-containing protein [uncultured Clostridium sp.]|uniref:YhgE/Pip domain-containing protein n=1 Tax=uncultured Clostridium sp. TaxID=59620 RepID=UPI00262B6A52|nr:YhgE/Pip domain-containing protein [uncultured Clostridium sp.]
MKTIFRILARDLKKIIKNPVAIVVILGICFIPSLYAWITLKANWDPYVNTSNISIGVVNEDFGTVVKGNIINVGDQVLDQLKTNHDIGWKFTSIEQGDEGLKDGQYYALIVIPKDFSKDLATLVTSNPVKPTLTYKVNDKTNIIATKITEVAKDQLTHQINDNFVKVVNQQAISLANSLGEQLKTNEPVLNQLKSVMNEADTRIGQITGNINQSSKSATELASYLSIMKNDLPKITGQMDSLQQVVNASKSLIASTQQNVSNAASNISNNTANVTTVNTSLTSFIEQLKTLGTSTADKENQIKIIDNAVGVTTKLTGIIDRNINILTGINKVFNNSIISANIQKLNDVKALIVSEQNQLNAVKTLLASVKPNVDETNAQLTKLQTMNVNLISNINNLTNSMYSQVVPSVNQISSNLTQGLSNANSLLETSKSVVPQLQALAGMGISTSNLTVSKANELKSKINGFKDTLNLLQDKAGLVSNKDLDNMIDMLSKNPEKISSFLSSPIQVKEEQVYGEIPFGAGLMPFYTTLAIWVGSLLLTSLLTVEAKNFKGEKANLLQVHFGKMLLFIIFSIIQTVIVTLGDKYVLGFSPYNMWLMMGIAILSSVVFTIIIYTLVSLFGSMGKAMAIVIMVLQVAGSGAIYPIQTNPAIFGKLEFLWPFKYAMDGFREAISGPIWSDVKADVIALLIFAGIFIVIGLLKPLLHKQTEFMEHKFKSSGL